MCFAKRFAVVPQKLVIIVLKWRPKRVRHYCQAINKLALAIIYGFSHSITLLKFNKSAMVETKML